MGEFDPPSRSQQISRPRPEGLPWSAILRVYPKSADVLRAARLQPLRYCIQTRRATVTKTISSRPILEECRGATRLRGSPVCDIWREQDLTPPPEPERGGDGTPGLGTYLGSSREGRTFPPVHPHYQPPQAATSLEEQQAAWRAEWEAQDIDAEAERDRLWAAAHLTLDLL